MGMISMKKMRKYILPMLVFASIFVFVACSFQESPDKKLVKAFVNTSKKINADFQELKKIAGINQDFSKGSVQELTVKNMIFGDYGYFFFFPDNIDGFEIRFLDSIEQKMLQTSLSAYFNTKKINFIGLQIDDEKIRLAFPDLSKHSFNISSKNLGRDLHKLMSSTSVYEEEDELDLSYSRLKSEMLKYGVDNTIEQYKKTWETLFKDAKITVEGDTYSCVVESKNIEEALKAFLPNKSSKNLILDQFIFRGVVEMADELKAIAEDGQIKVEAKLKGQYVESSKVTLVQGGEEKISVMTGFANISEKENIWKDFKLGLHIHETDEKLELHNTGEFSKTSIKNKTQLRLDDTHQADMMIAWDKEKEKDNLNLSYSLKAYGEIEALYEGKGELITDDKSFRLYLPKFKMTDYQTYIGTTEKMEKQFDFNYMMSSDISDRIVFKNEKYLLDLSMDEISAYFEEISQTFEELIYLNQY